MTISENTEMLLFRFSNYGKYSFIKEHKVVLDENGYVWMLKMGKRSSISKLLTVKEAGGWLVLRSPKAEGSVSFIAKFSDISEEVPENCVYPKYYSQILENEDEKYYNPNTTYQWFKIEKLIKMKESDVKNLLIAKTGKPVDEVISTTRTAVMFIRNEKEITI